MKKLIVIIVGTFLFVCLVQLATKAQAAACPPQRWSDPNSWFFAPDMNMVQGYTGESIKIEQGQKFGWWPNVCDEEGQAITLSYQLIPDSNFAVTDDKFLWTPPATGDHYLIVSAMDTPPAGGIPRVTTMTYGIKVVPRNVPPVIEPEIVNKLPFGD